jgi:hypothetical protein
MREFVDDCHAVGDLDKKAIRKHAQATWSTEAIGPRFEAQTSAVVRCARTGVTQQLNGGGSDDIRSTDRTMG